MIFDIAIKKQKRRRKTRWRWRWRWSGEKRREEVNNKIKRVPMADVQINWSYISFIKYENIKIILTNWDVYITNFYKSTVYYDLVQFVCFS